MENKSIGFIGGRRITRILLERMSNAGILNSSVVVSDVNKSVLKDIKNRFANVQVVLNDNKLAAKQDYVFISLHPPVFAKVMEEIKEVISPYAILISLTPKISISKIESILNGFSRIIRMNPNSPSIIGMGFNPIVFSNSITEIEKTELKNLFSLFGDSPEVNESLIESYAVITAMGPTYLQFQINKLAELAVEFGIPSSEVKETLAKMIDGSVKLWANSKYSFEEIYDLVPVKPLADSETLIKDIYRTKLEEIYSKLTN